MNRAHINDKQESRQDIGLAILPRTTIQRSTMARKRALILIIVHVLIAAHITHWQITGSTLSPLEPSEAIAFSSKGIINAGCVFFALAIVLTAAFGRWFCGWACHLVALQDLCRFLLAKVNIKPKPIRSRTLLWVPAIAFIYMFVYPLVHRLLLTPGTHATHYEFRTTAFWDTFPPWPVALVTLAICGFVMVYLLGAKGFCNYACPYGAIFGFVERLSPRRIRVTDACEGCGHCTAVCTSNVRVHEEVHKHGMVVDNSCMKCLDCVSVCPNDALYYGSGSLTWSRPQRNKRVDTNWPEECFLALSFATLFLICRGLYGVVPFLLAIALATCFSYILLQAARMLYQPHVRVRGWILKQHHKRTTTGSVFAAMAGLLIIASGHSAVVQYHRITGDRYYEQTADDRQQWSTESFPIAAQSTLAKAQYHLQRAHDLGLWRPARLHQQLAWLALMSGDSDGFEEHIQQAIAGMPQSPHFRADWASYLFACDRLQESQQEFEQIVQQRPTFHRAAVQLAQLHTQQGHLDSARRVLDEALKYSPTAPLLHYNNGVACAMQGQIEQAIVYFRQALDLEPHHHKARENLAGMLCQNGQFEEGISHYRDALQHNPQDAKMHLLLARAYLAVSQPQLARQHVEHAIKIDPQLAETHTERMAIDTLNGG